MTFTEYLCSHRKLNLSMKHAVGSRCYLGHFGDICGLDNQLCDVVQKHQLAQSSPSVVSSPLVDELRNEIAYNGLLFAKESAERAQNRKSSTSL